MFYQIYKKIKWLTRSQVRKLLVKYNKNWIGVFEHPPGHFYSPLLDISEAIKRDGKAYWKKIKIKPKKIKEFYKKINKEKRSFKRFHENNMFPTVDAIVLLEIIIQKKPKRVIEVGSGFSTLVFLDALENRKINTNLTCIEPFPERLKCNLSPHDQKKIKLIQKPLQDVLPSEFKKLKKNDILFIDSSHVAKIGSDVTYLFLQVLPSLAKGVLIHFHDIVYPYSYPMHWIQNGWAWNETLFLRTFLVESEKYEIIAFNSYFNTCFPKLAQKTFSKDEKTKGGFGGSIWLVKKY